MSYSYDRSQSDVNARAFQAAQKFPEVVAAMAHYFKNGPYKGHLKVKAATQAKIVLVGVNLNDQVDRIEITGLQGAKAEYRLFLKSGESGWDWDERRMPPQFWSNAGYNVIHLDRLKNPTVDPDGFNDQMASLTKDMVTRYQKAGWVLDPVYKKPLKLDAWKAFEAERAEARAKAEAEASAKAKLEASRVDTLRASIIEAIKRVSATVKSLGVVVNYYPKIDDNTRFIHGYFRLEFEGTLSGPYSPAISVFWDKGKEKGSVSASSVVWSVKARENVPWDRMESAIFEIADGISEDIKRVLDSHKAEQSTTGEAWSVVTLGRDHGYATEVDTFPSKEQAEAEARNLGNCYVVKGTQMWNEPLGQVEEHNRQAPYKFFQ